MLVGNRGLLHRQTAATFGLVPLQLATLPNTWAMTSDLCRYVTNGEKRNGLLIVWAASRDRHRFAKHCPTTTGGSCSFLHMKHFRVAIPPSVPRTLHCLSTLWLSYSPPVPENSPPPVLIRGSDLGDVVSRAVYCRILGLHERRRPLLVPFCSSPCQTSCSRHLFSLPRTAKRISRTVVDSCDCAQHNTSQSRTCFFTT